MPSAGNQPQMAGHEEVYATATPPFPTRLGLIRMIRIAYVSSHLPRRCGIATFTADLMAAVRLADPAIRQDVVAIDEPDVSRMYGPEARWRIRQEEGGSYRAAAAALNASDVDVVNVQHEFGLYGTWSDSEYSDHLRPFLATLRKPVVTTLHTIPPNPTLSMREAVRSIDHWSDEVVVMADRGAALLRTAYGIDRIPLVIPHGMPAIEPRGRTEMKIRLDLDGRTMLSTFGLVDPRKGLEYVIAAMPAILRKHPDAYYLIAGQTHPELVKRDGERYRESLHAAVDELGLGAHVGFRNEYMSQAQIIDLLLATDVYVTPYLDPQQITSGTLAYAMGAGKAIVSTAYLHALEALVDGRGEIVGFRDSDAIAAAVNEIVADPVLKARLERAAYAYAKGMAWPAAGARWLAMMRQMVEPPAAEPLVAVGAGLL